MHNQNCNHSQRNRYRYEGFWIRVFLEIDFERDAEGGTLSCAIAFFTLPQLNYPTKEE